MVRKIDFAVGLINALQHVEIITANLADKVMSVYFVFFPSFLKTSEKKCQCVPTVFNTNLDLVLVVCTAILLVLLDFMTNLIIF